MYDRLYLFAELLVGNTDDARVHHLPVPDEYVLDLLWIDVDPAKMMMY